MKIRKPAGIKIALPSSHTSDSSCIVTQKPEGLPGLLLTPICIEGRANKKKEKKKRRKRKSWGPLEKRPSPNSDQKKGKKGEKERERKKLNREGREKIQQDKEGERKKPMTDVRRNTHRIRSQPEEKMGRERSRG